VLENHGWQAVTPNPRFTEQRKMAAENAEGKKKKPRPASELLEIEDRIERMKGDFREIRDGMRLEGMETVDLSIGSFNLYLGWLEVLAKKYRGEFESQVMIKKTREAREKKKMPAEPIAKPRKK